MVGGMVAVTRRIDSTRVASQDEKVPLGSSSICPTHGWSPAVCSRRCGISRLAAHLPRTSWRLVGARGNLSMQYEHTMIITRGEPIVVTRH
jgi:methionine aminopeptidase